MNPQDLKTNSYVGCCYQIVTLREQLKTNLTKEWSFINEPESFISLVEESAAAWELNYLLFLGESIFKEKQVSYRPKSFPKTLNPPDAGLLCSCSTLSIAMANANTSIGSKEGLTISMQYSS